MDLHLFSEIEGRVPVGAHSAFISERIREHFDWPVFDLAPFGFPPGYFVKGPKDMIDLLRDRLKVMTCIYPEEK